MPPTRTYAPACDAPWDVMMQLATNGRLVRLGALLAEIPKVGAAESIAVIRVLSAIPRSSIGARVLVGNASRVVSRSVWAAAFSDPSTMEQCLGVFRRMSMEQRYRVLVDRVQADNIVHGPFPAAFIEDDGVLWRAIITFVASREQTRYPNASTILLGDCDDRVVDAAEAVVDVLRIGWMSTPGGVGEAVWAILHAAMRRLLGGNGTPTADGADLAHRILSLSASTLMHWERRIPRGVLEWIRSMLGFVWRSETIVCRGCFCKCLNLLLMSSERSQLLLSLQNIRSPFPGAARALLRAAEVAIEAKNWPVARAAMESLLLRNDRLASLLVNKASTRNDPWTVRFAEAVVSCALGADDDPHAARTSRVLAPACRLLSDADWKAFGVKDDEDAVQVLRVRHKKWVHTCGLACSPPSVRRLFGSPHRMDWSEASRRWDALCEVYESHMESAERHDLMCPILRQMPLFPVRCSDGVVYEWDAVSRWAQEHGAVSPMTRQELKIGEHLDAERVRAVDEAAERITRSIRSQSRQTLRA